MAAEDSIPIAIARDRDDEIGTRPAQRAVEAAPALASDEAFPRDEARRRYAPIATEPPTVTNSSSVL